MSIYKYINKIIRKNNEIVYLKQQRDLLKVTIEKVLPYVDDDIKNKLQNALNKTDKK